MPLYQLEKVLTYALLEGRTVKMGDWGTFYLTSHSLPSDTKQEATAKKISKINIRFLPSDALRIALQKATFVAAESLNSEGIANEENSGSGVGDTPDDEVIS